MILYFFFLTSGSFCNFLTIDTINTLTGTILSIVLYYNNTITNLN